MSQLGKISEHACFGGVQGYYRHASRECASTMRIAVYRPPQAARGPVPVVYYLAGLTCSEETFAIKAGAQRVAAELGLMLVAPDTSPREPRFAGDDASWDFGQGAGFYVDATEQPWSSHYRMYSYVSAELPALVLANFPARADAQGIFGHSMGGHGALVCGLRNPGTFRSVSAFAPIAAPTQCAWGHKALSGYLGEDRASWEAYDATALVVRSPHPAPILIDQGSDDRFLAEQQLLPERFAVAAETAGQQLRLRMQPGYDHGYFFIQSFVADHLQHHASLLGR
ncbi:MAG: S-formylglutathione hydrolase [Pseudomonadota bacterium]